MRFGLDKHYIDLAAVVIARIDDSLIGVDNYCLCHRKPDCLIRPSRSFAVAVVVDERLIVLYQSLYDLDRH